MDWNVCSAVDGGPGSGRHLHARGHVPAVRALGPFGRPGLVVPVDLGVNRFVVGQSAAQETNTGVLWVRNGDPYYIPVYSLRGTGAVGPVQRRRAGARRRRSRASAHGHFVGAQLGHVPSQQLQLLVALVVLLPQVLVLRFQVPQFVGHPFLDARRFGLDHFGVLEPQLTL